MLFQLANYIIPFYLLNPDFLEHINHIKLANIFKSKYILGTSAIS